MATKPRERENLIQKAAAKRDWPNLVQEIVAPNLVGHNLSSVSVRKAHDEVVSNVSELLQILVQKHFPVEYILSWMILVLRWTLEPSCNIDGENLSLEAELEEAAVYNDDNSGVENQLLRPLQIDVEHLRTELCTFDDEIQIGLVSLVNIVLIFTYFTRNDDEDLDMRAEDKSLEQAHIIVQILKSQSDAKVDVHQRTSFDSHVQNKAISQFWNNISIIPKNDSHQILSRTSSLDSATNPSYPLSSIWHPENVPKIIDTGDAISGHIVSAAQYTKIGMEKYFVPTITKGIEAMGGIVIHNTEPMAKPDPSSVLEDNSVDYAPQLDEEEKNNKNDLKEFIGISDKSVKATDSIRRGASSLAFGVRDFSTRQVHSATALWKEREIGKQIIPDDDVRETIVATGKIGVATLGASALLTETLFETVRSIAQTSVKVASDVVNHKYGEDAGKLVQNTGDATGNILRTITHVGMLEAQVMTKVIAKNTAKEEVASQSESENEKDPVFALKNIVKNSLIVSNVKLVQDTTTGCVIKYPPSL